MVKFGLEWDFLPNLMLENEVFQEGFSRFWFWHSKQLLEHAKLNQGQRNLVTPHAILATYL